MKIKQVSFILLVTIILSTSCFVNRTTIGYGPVGVSFHDQTYSVVKQQYIIFGLFSLNHPTLQLPPNGIGYEIKSDFSFKNGILTLITLGIYGERTVRILINNQDAESLKEKHR